MKELKDRIVAGERAAIAKAITDEATSWYAPS